MNPIITKGIGALTPDTWRRIIAAVNFVEQHKGNLNLVPPASAGSSKTDRQVDDSPFFYAKILGHGTLVASGGFTNRWKYSWQRVVLSDDGSYGQCTVWTTGDFDKLTGDLTDQEQATWAVNENELGNTAALQNGYAINTTTNCIQNANGLSNAPIPNGTVVRMISYRAGSGSGSYTSGRRFYLFSMTNPIIGTCTA